MSLLLGPCMAEMEKTKNKRCVQKLVTSGFLLYLEPEKSLSSADKKTGIQSGQGTCLRSQSILLESWQKGTFLFRDLCLLCVTHVRRNR